MQTSTAHILRMFLLTEKNLKTAEMYVIDFISDALPKKLRTSCVMKCGYGYEYEMHVDFGQNVGMKNCRNLSDIYIVNIFLQS